MTNQTSDRYFYDYSPSSVPNTSCPPDQVHGQQSAAGSSKVKDIKPTPPLVLLLRRPLSTIFASRLVVLLVAFCATLSTIQDHARILSSAVTAGCAMKEHIYLPSKILQLCSNVKESENRISVLSARVNKVEIDIAALRAENLANQETPLRNSALRGGGATIDPFLTSPTYRLPAQTLKSRFLLWFRGYDHQDTHINLPIVVLEDIVEVGECWEFEGGYGTVGIRLPESIHISSISLNYIRPSKVSALSMARAPKKFTLWAHISISNGAEAPSHPETRTFADRYFVPLVHAEYNISGEILLQNFPVTENLPQIESSYSTLILEITDNWGADTTCLYYLGVHGVSPGDL